MRTAMSVCTGMAVCCKVLQENDYEIYGEGTGISGKRVRDER